MIKFKNRNSFYNFVMHITQLIVLCYVKFFDSGYCTVGGLLQLLVGTIGFLSAKMYQLKYVITHC